MELGIKAREIMQEDFPLLDSSLTIEECMKKLKNREACIILKEGYVKNVLGFDDLLNVFLKRKKKNIKLGEIEVKNNFAIINPETDIFDVIKLMNKGIEFIVVKEGNYFGLISKEDIAEINQLLFDMLETRTMKVAA